MDHEKEGKASKDDSTKKGNPKKREDVVLHNNEPVPV